MNASRLYPGMCDDSQEYFYHEELKEVMVVQNGTTRKFSELKPEETTALDAIIDSDAKLRKILNKWFPEDRATQKQELAKCRFGGLNLVPDFSPCGKKPQHDFYNCKLFGVCEGEGIVCKALEYQGSEISKKEISAINLLITEFKNHEIAQKLKLPLGTFHVFKSNLYEKLNIHNKQNLTRVAVKLGIC